MKKFLISIFTLFLIAVPAFSTEKTEEYLNMTWWKTFEDNNLNENLIKLYQNNYDLKNAELKVKENEQAVRMQFAQELPSLYLTGEISRDLQAARKQYGDMTVRKYSQNNYNIPFTAGYEIDIWGKNRLKTKSQKEILEMTKQAERATYISLTSAFAADYFNLIKADKTSEIEKELVNTQQQILSLTKDKYEAGLCTINEVLLQEKLLTSFTEEYNNNLKTKEVLINNLNVYLAAPNSDVERNNYTMVRVPTNLPLTYNSDIVSNRPDFITSEAQIKKAGFDVKVAKREFLPSFTIFGQAGLNAYNLKSMFNSPSQFFTAGVIPSIDLFTGGRKTAFLKIKKYQYEQALNDYQQTYLTGIKEINSTLAEYKTALNNYGESQKRIEAESNLYNLAAEKRNIGSSGIIEVLLAKENYLITERENVSNKINTIISIIGLYKATGGTNLNNIEENI